MPWNTAIATAFIVVVFVKTALSSTYYNNEYFARVNRKDFVDQWSSNIDAHSFIKKPFSCEVIHE